ncbi:MAG TPA: hypothetical protein PLJ28_11345 [Citricoccus sp.]|nr:hypothetical protein [Citricoccus sp.]
MAAVAATETTASGRAGGPGRRHRTPAMPHRRVHTPGPAGVALPPGADRTGVPSRLAGPVTLAGPATLVAAGLAAASVPLHGWMLVAHSHGVVLSLLMGAMALWCLWCAVGAVRRGDTRTAGTACHRIRALRHLWVMAGVMALLHVVLLTGALGGGHHGAHGAGAGTATPATTGFTATAVVEPGAGAGTSLMLAIVALEVAVCFACALALRTRRPGGPRPGTAATRP